MFVVVVIFILIMIFKFWEMIIDVILWDMKLVILVGIGFFIVFIGFYGGGLIVVNKLMVVGLGLLIVGMIWLIIFGLIVMLILMSCKVFGGIFIGMVLIFILGLVIGLIKMLFIIVLVVFLLKLMFGVVFGYIGDINLL